MSLLVLVYHRASAGPLGNSAEMLDRHFQLIAARCANVLPGDALAGRRLNVCLSFDDGYFDFYATVYPLLKKHGLRALLAVAPGLIRDTSDAPAQLRMQLAGEAAFSQPDQGGFCTWGELGEMARSGIVRIAAHGYNHLPLDDPKADLSREIGDPRRSFREHLGLSVDTFVFPFGRFHSQARERAQREYPYVFRLGGAINYRWDGGILYRVGADGMASPEAPLLPSRLAGCHCRFFWNRMRGR